MRENMGLYRGKRKDTGEWVEGNLFENDSGNYPMVLIGHFVMSRDKHTKELSFDGFDLCEVDPVTVGQFTGMTDKNGTKIFEGDILKITWSCHDRDPVSERCFVEFSKGGFFAKLDGRYKAQVANYACAGGGISVEVIGNIHDNPELLEVSK